MEKYIFSFLVILCIHNITYSQNKTLKREKLKKVIAKDTTTKQKEYWDYYMDHTDESWPFFCANWGNTRRIDKVSKDKMIQLLDSPIYVEDVWDSSYNVQQFRFYYKNLEYTQNDTTLSYEPIYIGYSFYSRLPLKPQWKKFLIENLDPDETIIIDKIFIQNKTGTGFIVYDPIILTTY